MHIAGDTYEATFSIPSIARSDSGVYSCLLSERKLPVSNVTSSNTHSIFIRVEGKLTQTSRITVLLFRLF